MARPRSSTWPAWPRRSPCTGRPGGCGGAARTWSPSPASTCGSSGARWWATSAPTAPGSRRRSRCSPASSCRSSGHVRVDGLEPSRERIGAGATHRRGVRPALPALVGPAPSGQLRPAPPRVPRARRSARREPRPLRGRASTSGPLLDVPGAPAVARPADARRAHGRPAARPDASCCSTSPPSASTSSARRRCGSSSSPINQEQGTTVLLTTHDLTRRGAALRAAARSSTTAGSSRTAPSPGSRRATAPSAPSWWTWPSRVPRSRSPAPRSPRGGGPAPVAAVPARRRDAPPSCSTGSPPGRRARPLGGGTGHREIVREIYQR